MKRVAGKVKVLRDAGLQCRSEISLEENLRMVSPQYKITLFSKELKDIGTSSNYLQLDCKVLGTSQGALPIILLMPNP